MRRFRIIFTWPPCGNVMRWLAGKMLAQWFESETYSLLTFFTSVPSCLSSSLLPSSFVVCLFFLHPKKTVFFWSKGLVYSCFLVFHHTGEYIALNLFYFINLTSSCSLIPLKPAFDWMKFCLISSRLTTRHVNRRAPLLIVKVLLAVQSLVFRSFTVL